MSPTDALRPDHPAVVRLRRNLEGELHLDRFTRGRYATDASIYQIEPLAVVVPRSEEDLVRTVEVAAEHELPVVPRGAGTSQGGQAIGRGLVVDTTPHLGRVVEVDPGAGVAVVQPGLVLDDLNRELAGHGLHFPVDPATSSRATLGGMAGNNSAGARSIRHGMMVDNVRAVDAVLASGATVRMGPVEGDGDALRIDGSAPGRPARRIVDALRALHAREADEIARRFPDVARDVAGYRLNRLSDADFNLADVVVGSEGTLAVFRRLHLELARAPAHRVLGVCHFPDVPSAAAFVPRILDLEPSAVEMVDRALLALARENAAFRSAVDRFVEGDPGALLVVEFSGHDRSSLLASLRELQELVDGGGGPVVEAVNPELQASVWKVRKAGLNIAMSMTGDTKPLAFIEDCAVPVERLDEYVERLDGVFRRHGVEGLWYGHASVGCLHVRPALNVKTAEGVATMRSVAEEAFGLARELGGSHSGEHGDGIIRSEFHRPLLGDRIADAFGRVKEIFDADGLLNPGKIVDPPAMDDRSLFRYGPEYATDRVLPVLDWSEWGGLGGAVEMCNNNGACRKTEPGVMCPSYRATRDEKDVVRGRANTLRLAISGQLGDDAFTSEGMYETLDLCVGCKACRSECPTGVDVARMKVEFLHHYRERHGVPLRERLVAHLPRYAPWAARAAPLVNLRNRLGPLRWLGERAVGLSAQRALPEFRRDFFGRREGEGDRPDPDRPGTGEGRPEVALLVDTFSRWFEPEIPRAAVRVLRAAGRTVRIVGPDARAGERPLCCGRTYLTAGLVDEARLEAARTARALRRYAGAGVPVVGLEPSCLLTLRDELEALLPADAVGAIPQRAFLLEEYLARERAAGRLELELGPLEGERVLVHGHCHQKSFDGWAPQLEVLSWIPGLEVEGVESTCCGMAGSFGYEAEHQEASLAMAELDLLPAVRDAGPATELCADGTSCRSQIAHGTGRRARHTALLLAEALEG